MFLSVKWGEQPFCSPKHGPDSQEGIKEMSDVLNGRRRSDFQNVNQVEITPVMAG